jgi:hypothetical protein
LGSVAVPKLALERANRLSGSLYFPQRADELIGLVSGVKEIRGRASLGLSGSPADEGFGGPVPENDPAQAIVPLHRDIGGVFDTRPKAFGVHAEFFGGPACLADILNMGDKKPRLVLLIPDQGDVGQAPNDLAVVAHVAFFDGHTMLRVSRERFHALASDFPIVRVGEVNDVPMDEVFAGEAQHLAERPICMAKIEVTVGDHHADIGVLKRATELFLCLPNTGFDLAQFL